MDWLNNLSAAIDYIEEHLDGEISCEEAARIACCSPFYFQRMFTYVTGVTLSEYIRRRRMTQAAFALQRTDSRVMDVALTYGYSSPTSFHRAFQRVHGVTPTAARESGSVLQAYPPIRFRIETTGERAMPWRIADREPLRIVGVCVPLVEDVEENRRIVPGFWKRAAQDGQLEVIRGLCAREPQNPENRQGEQEGQSTHKYNKKLHKKNEPGYLCGISVYESPEEIRYYIGAVTGEPAPAGMEVYEIPAATWAIFENDGGFEADVQSVFRRFYTEWLPFSGYRYAGLPDVEVYPADGGAGGQGHSEVWIAVRKDGDEDASF